MSLPRVTLIAGDGARAEVCLHGAHVVSWIPVGGTERLFLSARSPFERGSAIRGGVPVIFPQFANVGPLPKHGFARTADWELVAISSEKPDVATARFRLSSSPSTQAIWPHDFVAELGVRVGGNELDMEFVVHNPGTEAATFTGALHTYIGVADVRDVIVRGLAGVTYRDSTAQGVVRVEESNRLPIVGEVNRIYLDVQSPVEVIEPTHETRVTMTGFTDVVVWNPGSQGSASLNDMEPDGYLRMLCIEAAAVGTPVVVEPGGTWAGTQRLSASNIL